MERKPSDKCLLCGTKDATKKNSHILPKFISSDFLGDGNKRGYVIDSKIGTKKVVQDSPKEDYIFCPDCEQYFSLIEGEIAVEIKKIHAEDNNDAVEPIGLENIIIPPKIFHLFYYSQFWRASISNLDLFSSFKLSKETEKYLKDELNKFNRQTKTDFYSSLELNELFDIRPYWVITSFVFSDKTKNLIFAPYDRSPYYIIADKFCLILYDKINEIPEENRILFNTEKEHRRTWIFPSNLWEKLMVDAPFSQLAERFKKNQENQTKIKSLAEQLFNLSSKEAAELREKLSEYGLNMMN